MKFYVRFKKFLCTFPLYDVIVKRKLKRKIVLHSIVDYKSRVKQTKIEKKTKKKIFNLDRNYRRIVFVNRP